MLHEKLPPTAGSRAKPSAQEKRSQPKYIGSVMEDEAVRRRSRPLADEVSAKISMFVALDINPFVMVNEVLVTGHRAPLTIGGLTVVVVTPEPPPPPVETQLGAGLHALVAKHVTFRLPPTLVRPAAHVKTMNEPPSACVVLSCVCDSWLLPVGNKVPDDISCVKLDIGHRPVPIVYRG